MKLGQIFINPTIEFNGLDTADTKIYNEFKIKCNVSDINSRLIFRWKVDRAITKGLLNNDSIKNIVSDLVKTLEGVDEGILKEIVTERVKNLPNYKVGKSLDKLTESPSKYDFILSIIMFGFKDMIKDKKSLDMILEYAGIKIEDYWWNKVAFTKRGLPKYIDLFKETFKDISDDEEFKEILIYSYPNLKNLGNQEQEAISDDVVNSIMGVFGDDILNSNVTAKDTVTDNTVVKDKKEVEKEEKEVEKEVEKENKDIENSNEGIVLNIKQVEKNNNTQDMVKYHLEGLCQALGYPQYSKEDMFLELINKCGLNELYKLYKNAGDYNSNQVASILGNFFSQLDIIGLSVDTSHNIGESVELSKDDILKTFEVTKPIDECENVKGDVVFPAWLYKEKIIKPMQIEPKE